MIIVARLTSCALLAAAIGAALVAAGCSGNPVEPPGPTEGRVIRVPSDASTISAGLMLAASGDTVLVAPGLYTENGLHLGSGVFLLADQDRGIVTIDAQWEGPILFCEGTAPGTVVTGFTFTRGLSASGGGAISCDSCTLSIRSCSFADNAAWFAEGGAIWADGSSLTVEGCHFQGNHSEEGAGGAIFSAGTVLLASSTDFSGNDADHFGGAICCRYGSSASLAICSITDNSADLSGGALTLMDTTPASLSECTFSGNTAYSVNGGAIECVDHSSLFMEHCTLSDSRAGQTGGAVYCFASSPCVADGCTFSENTAPKGGAFYAFGDSPLDLDGCVFVGNSATDYGGGAALYCSQLSHCRMADCTLFGNDAAYDGLHPEPTVACEWTSDLDCQATIIAFAVRGCAVECGEGSVPQFTCCDIYGNPGGDWTGAIADQSQVDGNMSLDPLFCDPEGGDFALAAGSPCALGNNSCGVTIGPVGVGCSRPPN
jgi:predicted outer membrane repeat protein